MSKRKSLSPFNEKIQIIQFSCLRIEFVVPLLTNILKIVVCEKYTFIGKSVDERCAIINQAQVIEVLNDKIHIEIQNIGFSSINLNTYQAFSLEKVPIYDKKQLIGFLCFKIDQAQKRSTPLATLSSTREQSNSNQKLFTKICSSSQKNQISLEEIQKNIDSIAQTYEEMSREQNSLLQQDIKLKKLENDSKELSQLFTTLNEKEMILDQQFKKLQTQSPQLTMLLNQKISNQFLIANYQRKEKKQEKIEKPIPQLVQQFQQNLSKYKKKNYIPQQVTISLIEPDKKQEPEIPVNMSIPFSFNEYFSLYKEKF